MAGAAHRSGGLQAAMVVAPEGRLRDEFLGAASNLPGLFLDPNLAGYPNESAFRLRLRQARPPLLFVDVDSNPSTALRLIEAAMAAEERPLITALADGSNPSLVIECLQRGTNEVLTAPFAGDSIQSALMRLAASLPPPSEAGRRDGRLLAVAACKRGSGATTLASAAAQIIGSGASGKTKAEVLIIHLRDGVAASSTQARTLTQATGGWVNEVVGTGTYDYLDTGQVWGTSMPDAHTVAGLVKAARMLYDVLIVDLPCLFYPASLTIAGLAEMVWAVASPDLAGLYLAQRGIRALQDSGVAVERFSVAVNRWQDSGGLQRKEMEKLLQGKLGVVVPELNGSPDVRGPLAPLANRFLQKNASKAG